MKSLNLLFCFAALVICMGTAAAEEPFRLQSALDLPDWLKVSGETRGRYETLDGQFRANGSGGDQILAFRSFLLVEADTGPAKLGLELQDSRTYLDDAGTPLSRSFVDPLDFLQAYAKFNARGFLGQTSETEVIFGRQVVSIGSKRQIERTDFTNVVKSYTGVHATSKSKRGDELHLLYVVPVERHPTSRMDLDDNVLAPNREAWDQRIWAVHYRRADAVPEFAPDIWGELFVYGLDERDAAGKPTANREYITPGFRLYRAASPGAWDMDVEGAWRFGSRRASSDPGDVVELDVSASMLLVRFGQTLEKAWQPNIAAQIYWASGDNNPADDQFGRYEPFGGRRSDLNNTSIYGPLSPSNLLAPGLRFEVKPNKRWDARLHYSAAYLASDTDRFAVASLQDPSGQSGDFMGHTLDARARYWIVPESLQLEVGASAFFFGEFTKNVPDGPAGSRTLFAYSQLSFEF